MTKTQIIVGVLAILLSSLYFIYGANWKQTLLDQTIEFNNWVYAECFSSSQWVWQQWTGNSSNDTWNVRPPITDTQKYRTSTDCWKSKRRMTPDDLYLSVPKYLVDEGKCAISQSEDEHVSRDRGGMYATDLACKFEGQGVYAPDYLDQMIEYKIESVWYDNLLGNFVILWFKESNDVRWYFWHTVLIWWLKVGDTIATWTRFGKADLSWVTSGSHTHIELRRMYDGVWQSVRYSSRNKEKRLEEKRMRGSWSNSDISISQNTYYFTAYDLGDPNQNDASPYHWASWVDLRDTSIKNPVAITVDIRKKLWIKFWDKVKLAGLDGKEYIATVHDEMNLRYRTKCILKPWTQYCIKWDIARLNGKSEIPSWPYTIIVD